MLLGLFVWSSCGTAGGGRSKSRYLESGVASWYGPKFHGRLTANGETYDMDGITAAHRTLPFNTVVLVENQDNGRKLEVRINDRGPFAKNRIIDLSRGAARKLGVIGPGTANVKLYLVKGDLRKSKTTNLKVARYTVQLGSYKRKDDARDLSRKIKKSRVESVKINGERFYRVYYGVYKDPAKAERDQRRLKRRGYKGFVKQIENG
jgi:rare lipoprotein A